MNDLHKKAQDEDRVFTNEEKTEFQNLQKEFEDAKNMAEMWNQTQSAKGVIDEPANNGADSVIIVNDKQEGPFKNLTQQLKSVRTFANRGHMDERLQTLNAAAGLSESSAAESGFPVQSDFAGVMFETAVKESPLVQLVDTYPVSGSSNAVEWVEVDEQNIEEDVFGGVRVYWAAEAGSIDSSMPKLKDAGLKLEKLMGLAYCTYELNEDSSFVDSFLTRAFTTGIKRKLESAIVGGTGAGVPLGVLKSSALVEVAKESGQAADTVTYKNLSAMYHRGKNKANMIWVMHPDVNEQLDFLEMPVGTGGLPVYLQETKEGSVATLRGKRIVESDQCSALGDKGDIVFMDPKEWLLIYKGGIKKDMSIHVQFLTAQNAFRFIFRANGMPKVSSKLTIKNSSKKRSPFVTLADRA